MTPSGIEPASFRFVAQYLNYCATISSPLLTPIAVASIILKRMKRIYSAFKIQLKAAAYIKVFKSFP
jgi:hypothetical protein